jgi:hypothetical protein
VEFFRILQDERLVINVKRDHDHGLSGGITVGRAGYLGLKKLSRIKD